MEKADEEFTGVVRNLGSGCSTQEDDRGAGNIGEWISKGCVDPVNDYSAIGIEQDIARMKIPMADGVSVGYGR